MKRLRRPNALVQLQAHYNHCGEAASEKCLSAATFVRQLRHDSAAPGTRMTTSDLHRSAALHTRSSGAIALPPVVLDLRKGHHSQRFRPERCAPLLEVRLVAWAPSLCPAQHRPAAETLSAASLHLRWRGRMSSCGPVVAAVAQPAHQRFPSVALPAALGMTAPVLVESSVLSGQTTL